MAELMQNGNGRGNGKKGRRRAAPLRVDFTPMVDLACLLLTFFMLTTVFSRMHVMEAVMPKTGGEPAIYPPKTMTVLLDESKENIYYYFGKSEPGMHLYTASLSKEGLHKLLFDKNGPIIARVAALKNEFLRGAINETQLQDRISKAVAGKDALPVIIKAGEKARYETVVKVIDEMNQCSIGQYNISDITPEEKEALDLHKQTAQQN